MESFAELITERILQGNFVDPNCCPSVDHWIQEECDLGVKINKHYKMFVSMTGRCSIGEFTFLSPLHPLSLRTRLVQKHEGYTELWKGIASLYPDSGGLMELCGTGTRRTVALSPGETGTVHILDHDHMVCIDLGYDFDEFILRVLDVNPSHKVMEEIFQDWNMRWGYSIIIESTNGRKEIPAKPPVVLSIGSPNDVGSFKQLILARVVRGNVPHPAFCPTAKKWTDAEAELGLALNKFYKTFVSCTGICQIGLLSFINPSGPEVDSLHEELVKNHHAHAKLWKGIAKLYPDRNGLLAIGLTGARRQIAISPGETGTVHILDKEGMACVNLGYDFNEFILRILDLKPSHKVMEAILYESGLFTDFEIMIMTIEGRKLMTKLRD
jgi:hypothetical protein